MPFTPVHTLVGGALLHLSTSSLLSDTGRVFGVSGVVDGAIFGDGSGWRWSTIFGLFSGPLIGLALGLEGVYASDPLSGWATIGLGRSVLAGLLVGLGSRLGSGCTSGHFLCGVSRGSKRSIIATATFFSTALLTANIVSSPSSAGPSPAYKAAYPTQQLSIVLFTTFLVLRGAHVLSRRYLSAKASPSTISRNLPYALAGLTFSVGLLYSGMADPNKVLSFLHPLPPFTTFDPSLAMILISGVLPNAVHWYTIPKGKAYYPWENWSVPNRKDIDWRLIFGSAIFGIGWGLAGICPGPAVVGLGRALAGGLYGEGLTMAAKSIGSYIGAMVIGMGLARGI